MRAASAARPGMAGWLLLCGAAAMLPDLDVITFKLGIPYASPWGIAAFPIR